MASSVAIESVNINFIFPSSCSSAFTRRQASVSPKPPMGYIQTSIRTTYASFIIPHFSFQCKQTTNKILSDIATRPFSASALLGTVLATTIGHRT